MERLGDLLPLLIFILIPVLRGLNNSKKQKQEYQQRRKNVKTLPSQGTKSLPSKPWRSFMDEVGKDMKGFLETEKKPEQKATHKVEQGMNNYSKDKEKVSLNNVYRSVEKYEHFEGKPQKVKGKAVNGEEIKDYIGDDKAIRNLKKKHTNPLEFSSNPIVQGLIFSEILGPPKSKRNK